MGHYAIKGKVSGELLSYRGAVLWHDNEREIRWLFMKSFELQLLEIVELPARLPGRPVMRLKDHPDLASVTWPLNPADFR